jgi:hypothetical protein
MRPSSVTVTKPSGPMTGPLGRLAYPTRIASGGDKWSVGRSEGGISERRLPCLRLGTRDYYMARNPGIGDILRAVASGPAVMLVIPLKIAPAAFFGVSNAGVIHVSPGGIERLSQLLWNYLGTDEEGALPSIGAGLSLCTNITMLRAPVRSGRTTRLKRPVRRTRRFWSISASGEAQKHCRSPRH